MKIKLNEREPEISINNERGRISTEKGTSDTIVTKV